MFSRSSSKSASFHVGSDGASGSKAKQTQEGGAHDLMQRTGENADILANSASSTVELVTEEYNGLLKEIATARRDEIDLPSKIGELEARIGRKKKNKLGLSYTPKYRVEIPFLGITEMLTAADAVSTYSRYLKKLPERIAALEARKKELENELPKLRRISDKYINKEANLLGKFSEYGSQASGSIAPDEVGDVVQDTNLKEKLNQDPSASYTEDYLNDAQNYTLQML